MSTTFRFARPEEIPEVGRLASHSFPAASRPLEWWNQQLEQTLYGNGAEIIWVGEEGGRIVAACQLHRLQEWIAGAALPTMGLGTVAIAPTHRQRGMAGRLTASALRAARERGDLASALYPFRASFYAKQGYGLAGEALQYRVPADAFPPSDERARVELADTEAVRSEVRAAYADWAARQTGQLVRTERVWEQRVSPADRALVAYRAPSGRVEGYALLVYRTDLPPQDRYLEVDELVWLSEPARRGLYGWLGTLGDQWQHVLVRSLPEHRLGDWLREPRLPWGSAPSWGLWFPSATLLHGPMFRLLDLRAAWERRAVAPEVRLAVALDVQDDQLAENAGAWRLRLEGGRVGVERGGGGADLTLRLRIESLARLFIGALPPSAATQAGLVTADRADRLAELDRALRLPQPWTFDRF